MLVLFVCYLFSCLFLWLKAYHGVLDFILDWLEQELATSTRAPDASNANGQADQSGTSSNISSVCVGDTTSSHEERAAMMVAVAVSAPVLVTPPEVVLVEGHDRWRQFSNIIPGFGSLQVWWLLASGKCAYVCARARVCVYAVSMNSLKSAWQ